MPREVDMMTGEVLPTIRGQCAFVRKGATIRCNKPATRVVHASHKRKDSVSHFACFGCEDEFLRSLVDKGYDCYVTPWRETE